eukprot:GHRR01032405.1.p1 GENE.GHRR01032405.1~~GHRR01032405.1.p1  ORF type:complete len:206 (+),score=50.97 GHRR01032405.1:319-936(+)
MKCQKNVMLLHVLLVVVSITIGGAARTARQQLRILAIGDSITEGAVAGRSNHPYTWELENQLRKKLGAKIVVDNRGVGGAGIYAQGFQNPTTLVPVAQQALSSRQKYDYVIVLLGINDLLRQGKSAEDVKAGLQQIYDAALQTGATVIAIPPFPAPGYVSQGDYKEQERQKLADMIKAVADGSRGKIIVLDLGVSFWDSNKSPGL